MRHVQTNFTNLLEKCGKTISKFTINIYRKRRGNLDMKPPDPNSSPKSVSGIKREK